MTTTVNRSNVTHSGQGPIPVASFGRRLLAAVYDGLLVFLITFFVTFAIGFVGLMIDIFNQDSAIPVNGLIVAVAIVVSAIYYIGAWASSGQTIGKSMLGLKVVSTRAGKLGYGKALGRYVGYIISGLILSLGFLWISFDPRGQGWHDKIAGTFVVDADQDLDTDARQFAAPDHGRRWLWLALWLVLLLIAPAALLSSLWILGPALNNTITSWLSGLLT